MSLSSLMIMPLPVFKTPVMTRSAAREILYLLQIIEMVYPGLLIFSLFSLFPLFNCGGLGGHAPQRGAQRPLSPRELQSGTLGLTGYFSSQAPFPVYAGTTYTLSWASSGVTVQSGSVSVSLFTSPGGALAATLAASVPALASQASFTIPVAPAYGASSRYSCSTKPALANPFCVFVPWPPSPPPLRPVHHSAKVAGGCERERQDGALSAQWRAARPCQPRGHFLAARGVRLAGASNTHKHQRCGR